MNNRNGKQIEIRFDIYNYLNQKHFSTKIGNNDTIFTPDFIFQFDSLSDLEQAIENLIELRDKFLEDTYNECVRI